MQFWGYSFSCHLIRRLCFFVLKILIDGIKLPFLMQGKVGKSNLPNSAPTNFLMGVERFIVKY